MKNLEHDNSVIAGAYQKHLLFLIALFDFMGFTIAATVFPELLLNIHCGILAASVTHETRIMLIGILLALYPLGQFLGASVLGSLSDRFGRKPILMLTLLGTLLGTLGTAWAISARYGILLFVSRVLLGLFAGNVSVAQASMIDLSTHKTKASNISLIQLSLGLAWVFGAPIGSMLTNSSWVSWFSPAVPFWSLFIVLVVLFSVCCWKFQETLQTRHPHLKISITKSFSLVYEAFQQKEFRKIFFVWSCFICGWAMFLQFLPTLFILKFNYTSTTVGPMLALMGGTFACTQIFIARRFLKKHSARSILSITMLVPGLAVLGVVFSQGLLELHIAALLFPFFMGFTLPALLAEVSSAGSPQIQGKLMGMAQSLQALVTIIATVLGGKLMQINADFSSLMAAALMLFAWGILSVRF